MFFWLALSFGAFCVVGASLSLLVLWLIMFLDKRPWLKFALRNPRVIWYWASTWRTRRRIARDAKANATGKARQEEIGKVVLFGVDAMGGGSAAKVERVEYWSTSNHQPLAVYNLDPDAGETHQVTFPPRATYASVAYRYNDIGYVGLLDKAQDGMDASVGIQHHVGFMGRNFIYDITSGNPELNEAVERVFGPFGCYRGLPTHLFDYLSRFDNDGGDGGGGTTVIVRGLQRSFLLDMRTREIQPFQGNMDNTRVVQPPFVFHGLAESVEAADLLFGGDQGGHVDVDYDHHHHED